MVSYTAVFLLALVASAAAAPRSTGKRATCPRIVTRAQWGARSPTSSTYIADEPTPFAVVHHAVSSSCSTQASCTSLVQGFQDQHMDVNGWSDIGYNFLIGGDGNVYEGRGWDYIGAHAPGYNSISMGFCFIGTFTSGLPTAGALAALQQMLDCGVTQNLMHSQYGLIGHRQAVDTECPGNALYNHIQTWSHWENVFLHEPVQE